MATTKGRLKNPALENIREDVPEPPDINETIKHLITTPKIHAAYLFHTQRGCVLLQKLCVLLSGTKPSYHYPNWEEFGITLGLEPIIIKSIKYSLQNEDPTSYVLLAYVQKDVATIEQILYALKEIKRFDILLELRDLIEKMCDEILIKYKPDYKTEIIKPPVAPNCPFVLKNLDNLGLNCGNIKLITEIHQKSSPIISAPKRNGQHYTKTVLLTYSSDVDQLVEELLIHLRKPRQNLQLGIVVLNEHKDRLNVNPEEFIFECFAQADYIFPIITHQYIKQVMNKSTYLNVSALENPDHKYVKYIYKLMNTHYLRNGCKNTTVRCLLPDEIATSVLKHPIIGHPLFQIWIRTSEINALINAILKIKY